MNSRSEAAPESTAEHLRARRREARIATNRADILDAAERVFAERGLTEGSLRDIASLSGFSTAAIYNYFENKQHLLAEALSRRGVELLEQIDVAAQGDGSPLTKLHRIVDVTVALFQRYPNFRQMLRHASESEGMLAAVIAEYAGGRVDLFAQSLTLMTSIVEEGQQLGEIRNGSAGALIRLYMVLVNEHVSLSTIDDPEIGSLSLDQFHGFVDGALRRPLD
jgi:TetR/AcrR family acrAB operon transcriptional repressor